MTIRERCKKLKTKTQWIYNFLEDYRLSTFVTFESRIPKSKFRFGRSYESGQRLGVEQDSFFGMYEALKKSLNR